MRKLFFFLFPNFSSARGSFQSDFESDDNFPETFTESVYLAEDSLQSRGNYRGNNNRPKVVEDPSTIIFWDTNFKESLFFSTKTIVGLDLEWKNDFSDRNTNAFFEIEKNISNAFLAIRRKGKNF